MHSNAEQVKQLLVNANQTLNFLRIVIDDLIFKRGRLLPDTFSRLKEAQEKYKKHKAVLINVEKLLGEQQYPLPEKLSKFLAESLRKRISLIIEAAIELDKGR